MITNFLSYCQNRLKPDFLIIGGVKCASSSLFRYLIDHPAILPGEKKEPGFFNDKNLLKAFLTLPRYLNNFPKQSSNVEAQLSWPELNEKGEIYNVSIEKKRAFNQKYITGEATATYSFSANPKVVKYILPETRIIALLRNPTDRFISHYDMFERFHKEGRGGYNVGELVPFIHKEIGLFKDQKQTRILHQGLYHHYLSQWKDEFGEKKVFIASSNDLISSADAISILNKITTFLNLPPHDFTSIVSQKFNVSPRKTLNKEAVEVLNDFYSESNQLVLDHFKIALNE